MEDTFRSNLRSIALPLILTAIIVGAALGFAFS
jgi:ABC-type spermidine/putrescine transport system permease subunit II